MDAPAPGSGSDARPSRVHSTAKWRKRRSAMQVLPAAIASASYRKAPHMGLPMIAGLRSDRS